MSLSRLIGPVLIATGTTAADASGKLLEGHDVNIATAMTIAVFAGSACLWISRQFARRDMAEAERTVHIEAKIARLEQKIDDLPCPGRHGCHPE